MYSNAYDHRIFDPSTSWIKKAGVQLDYTPEDTLKSGIFARNELPNDNSKTQAYHESEARESPDGSLPTPAVESLRNSSTPIKTEDRHQQRKTSENSQAQPLGGRRPAPFLKRRQGMSAWCSKIRKQGLPVPDPAEEVRQRQQCNSLVLPSRASSVNSSRPKSSTLAAPRTRSVTDHTSNQFLRDPLRKPNSLWCGLKHRRCSSGSLNEDIASRDPNITVSRSPFKQNQTATAQKVTKSPSVSTAVGDELQKDAVDLEEFEFLEEMAENSSFSSLTTSFINKLGKNNLKDRLKRAEEKLEQLALNDTSNCAENSSPQACEPETAQNGSPNGINTRLSASPERLPERSIFSVLDKYRSRRNSEQLSLAGDRAADSILADAIQSKGRKVARFQFVHERSLSKEDKSLASEATNVPTNTVEREVLPDHPEAKPSLVDNSQDGVEFDDANSWTCSASDLNDEADRPKVSSALDLSVSTASNLAALQNCESQEKISESRGKDSFMRYRGRSSSKSPCPKPRDNFSDCPSFKRFTARPLSATSHLGSRPGHMSRNVMSSYEDELINLADDFVDQLKREPSSIGGSAAHTQAVLRQWISRLEAEVRRFKLENATLLKMRSERDESMRRLEMETKRFEEFKAREIRLFTEMKENEMRKLKKERRVLEEYERALKSMPSKKDREEIERLKEELHESRSDLSRREVRWHAAIARLRARIEELEHERDELKGRIQRLEEDRISLQSQLAELKVSGNVNKLQIRRNTSTASSVRQTLSSVTQSIALKASRSGSDESKNFRSPGVIRRLRQQKQYLSSCRLSGRPVPRLAATESSPGTQAQRPITPTIPSSTPFDLPSVQTDRSGARTAPTLHQAIPSTLGTRESVVSAGYFTGDDDGASTGSGRADVQQSGGDVAPEQNTVACTTVNCPSAPSLHAMQVLSPLASKHDPDSSLITEVKTDTQVNGGEKLPAPRTAAAGNVIRTVKHADGSVEETYSNGAVVVTYSNGSVKEVFPDGITVVVSLFNGDIKRTLPDGRVIYHYAADGTVQTTHPDGTEEINYADGRQEIIHVHPESSKGVTGNSKEGQTKRPGDHHFRRLPNGDREIRLPNGQREIHSASGVKCRIYPDGTTKTVFPDGRHETRYSSGRLRVKDALGNLILDTRIPTTSNPFPDPPCNLPKAACVLPSECAS